MIHQFPLGVVGRRPIRSTPYRDTPTEIDQPVRRPIIDTNLGFLDFIGFLGRTMRSTSASASAGVKPPVPATSTLVYSLLIHRSLSLK
jgi:hypothetical protein